MAKVFSDNQITLKWSDKYNLEDVFDNPICQSGTGVYCITIKTGGREIIIYIGITEKNFYSRLSEHDKYWLGKYKSMGRYKVRFGSIQSPKTHYRKLVEDIEGGLIYQLQPIRNRVKKDIPTRNKYLIHNVGSGGLIPKIINMDEHIAVLNDRKSSKTGWGNPD